MSQIIDISRRGMLGKLETLLSTKSIILLSILLGLSCNGREEPKKTNYADAIVPEPEPTEPLPTEPLNPPLTQPHKPGKTLETKSVLDVDSPFRLVYCQKPDGNAPGDCLTDATQREITAFTYFSDGSRLVFYYDLQLKKSFALMIVPQAGFVLYEMSAFFDLPSCKMRENSCEIDAVSFVDRYKWLSLSSGDRYYNFTWDAENRKPLALVNHDTLEYVERYQNGPCQYKKAGESCTFESRTFVLSKIDGQDTLLESISAYGMYWNFTDEGKKLVYAVPDSNDKAKYPGSLCAGVPRCSVMPLDQEGRLVMNDRDFTKVDNIKKELIVVGDKLFLFTE